MFRLSNFPKIMKKKIIFLIKILSIGKYSIVECNIQNSSLRPGHSMRA